MTRAVEKTKRSKVESIPTSVGRLDHYDAIVADGARGDDCVAVGEQVVEVLDKRLHIAGLKC